MEFLLSIIMVCLYQLAALAIAYTLLFGGILLFKQSLAAHRESKSTDQRKSIEPPHWPHW